jgi:N6-adenosine-specific RNA methylase IME4
MAVDTAPSNVVIEQIDINLLKPHPRNVEIYGEEDVTELVDYIRDSKWIKPIVISQNNVVISGHRRIQAAPLAGYTKIPYVRQYFETETDELKALLLENASRDKTPEQKVREAGKWKGIEEEAKQRQLSTLAQYRNSENDIDYSSVSDEPSLTEKGKSSDKIAAQVGFKTGRALERAAKVVNTADQMIGQGEADKGKALLKVMNEESVNAATNLLCMPEPIKEEILEAIASGKADDYDEAKKLAYQKEEEAIQLKRLLKEQEREKERDENRRKIAKAQTIEEALQAAKFSTIMIDPPWDWGDEGDVDQFGRARPTYGTMTIDQLLNLPVGNYADEDSHIYLWITNRSLPKGFQLLEQWGFRYVTCITWKKPYFGMGNYFRGQTEHLLFGVRGSLMLKRRDVGTIFDAPRGPNGHSSKPLEFYPLIESCSPGPYLELFARSERNDWTSWGAEI